jgi:opacity protein-like surface antigen
MKKIIAMLALSISSAVYAASATVEYQSVTGVNGSKDQAGYLIAVREDINKNFTGDVVFSTRQTDITNSLSTSIAAGITSKVSSGTIRPFLRISIGERFVSSGSYSFYSIEPGITVPFGSSGISGRLGWRYRDAFSASNNNETRTWRAGASYAVNKENSIGVRYEQVRGDSNQNSWNFNYTRNF